MSEVKKEVQRIHAQFESRTQENLAPVLTEIFEEAIELELNLYAVLGYIDQLASDVKCEVIIGNRAERAKKGD